MGLFNHLSSKLDKEYRHDEGRILLQNQRTLRIVIGVLGLSLPVLLPLTVWIDSGYRELMPSISHYYHTRASGIFLIIVSMLAVFLLIYKGKERIDFYLSTLAGTGALVLLLFPTNNPPQRYYDAENVAVTMIKSNAFRTNLHYGAAAVFLASLAAMSLWLFTRSLSRNKAERTPEKNLRNKFYIILGVIMLLAIAIVPTQMINDRMAQLFDDHSITFWCESVAVWAFGFSWLIKAEVFLADKPIHIRSSRLRSQAGA